LKIKFTLVMERVKVEDKDIDKLVFTWISDLTQDEVLSLSHQWISQKDLLTQRLSGLKKVDESSLTIEPVEEII
jgi:hypothetical protein